MSHIITNKINDDILEYLLKNEFFFISILDKFNQNYSKIPHNLNFNPFYENNQIDSLLVYTDNGFIYPHIKEKYISSVAEIINNLDILIFSMYGDAKTIVKIQKQLKYKFRNQVDHNFMKLDQKDFIPFNIEISGFFCKKCNSDYFKYLKRLQYLYHIEEVYKNDKEYPYEAEMEAYKNILDKRLNFAIFKKNDDGKIAVSKANVNGESPNCYQIGGIYTLKEYRNQNLSKICLTNLIKYSFLEKNKNNILLYVNKLNTPAFNVYKKLGFKTLFEAKLYYY
jgi:ribosomal protein S18 acetylase RimI-like enzyme